MSESRQSPAADRPSGAQRVNWLELFYDLVFVAAIVTFSDAVSERPGLRVIGEVVGAFAAVWWIWLVTTLLANRFPASADDTVQRGLILVQMLLLLLLALNVGAGIEEHESFVSIAYALLCADVATMHARHASSDGTAGVVARARRNEYALATVPFFVAGIVDGPLRYVLWVIGFLVIIVPTVRNLFGPGQLERPLDESHLVERFGLLTIIVCGESFVKVSLLSSSGNFDSLDVLVMSALVVLVFAIWWSYFDDIPAAGLPGDVGRFQLWCFAHLCFQVAVVGIAVGYGELLELDAGGTLGLDLTLLSAGPIVVALLALALLGSCTRRVPVAPLVGARLGAAAVVALAGVAVYVIDSIDATAVTFAAVVLAQVAVAARLRRRTLVPEA